MTITWFPWIEGRLCPFSPCLELGCKSLQAKGLPSHQWWEHPQCNYIPGRGKWDRVKRRVGTVSEKRRNRWKKRKDPPTGWKEWNVSVFLNWDSYLVISMRLVQPDRILQEHPHLMLHRRVFSLLWEWRVAPTQRTEVSVDKDTKCFSHAPMYPGKKSLGSLG